MDTLKDIIADLHVFIYGGIATLPLTIAGTMMILGLFTANYAMLFFLLGYLIGVPLIAWGINFIGGAIFEGKSFNPFRATSTDICKIIVPYTSLNSPVGVKEQTVITSTWTAMIAFFTGYIFTNGINLYNRETPDTTVTITTDAGSDISNKVASRKTQAMIAMASVLFFAIVIFGYRLYTGCDTITGLIITIILFSLAGNGWYKALAGVGQDRLSDLFGIANRLLSPGAIMNGPIACVPIRS
jgi:hypothetical protein